MKDKHILLELLDIAMECGRLQMILVHAKNAKMLHDFEIELKQVIRIFKKKLRLMNLNAKEVNVDADTRLFLQFARSKFEPLN